MKSIIVVLLMASIASGTYQTIIIDFDSVQVYENIFCSTNLEHIAYIVKKT